MDISDIFKMGADLFQDRAGEQVNNLNNDSIKDAISGLFSDDQGNFDLTSIASKAMNGDGLGSIISSWLGDGENKEIDSEGLKSLLGDEKISEFANKLGVDKDTALNGLKDAIPNMVDKSSENGSVINSLLSSIGGSDDIMNMVGKLFNDK